MSYLRSLFLRNSGLKMLSLLLAFLLWAQIAGREEVQRIVSAPIVFTNMPPGVEITGDFPTKVDIIIRSERPGTQIGETELAVIVDLSAARPGVQTIPLSEKNVANKPLGVEIVNLVTSRLRITLERVEQRGIVVRPRVIGSPAPGFRIEEIRAEPASITVIGPESKVRRIHGIATESVNIDGVSTTTRRLVYLHLPDPPVRLAGRQDVTITVEIVPVEKK
ncbi:MAG: CdaR family protein [Acidobacteriota bacterium]